MIFSEVDEAVQLESTAQIPLLRSSAAVACVGGGMRE